MATQPWPREPRAADWPSSRDDAARTGMRCAARSVTWKPGARADHLLTARPRSTTWRGVSLPGADDYITKRSARASAVRASKAVLGRAGR